MNLPMGADQSLERENRNLLHTIARMQQEINQLNQMLHDQQQLLESSKELRAKELERREQDRQTIRRVAEDANA